ncbi:uncharacterized protein LX73_2119 [Fodinibius salinus]|uniref:TPM domain-containing protein n=1 Tax=Fodinibius salinus TaxID=860790 RepID=A0A5D3YHF6_9BACT|nr:TPM domain-containing protein [Fodinibius salinus]TYP92754.1 uncharacterized protein LX73_2119 [Fodinibius salinus]
MTFSRFQQSLSVLLLSSVFLLCLLPTAVAQNLPSEPSGHVNDYAHMLSNSDQERLETKLRNYRDTTTTVIAIAMLKSLNGVSIEETATTLFNDWKMWQGNKDNGVLIVVAKEEQKMRIEVGYGLEGAIPDIMAGRIIRQIMNPNFKKGNYYKGLDEATSALIQLSSGEFEGQLTKKSSEDDDMASYIIFALFIIFVIYSSSRKGRGKGKGKRRRTLGPAGFILFGGGSGGSSIGGGSSGGFGGFSGGGGFGSGGGGASGGW